MAGGLFFFHSWAMADSFQRPEHGLSFGAVQKINEEMQTLYAARLKSYMSDYVQGVLQFTTDECQIRDPQMGCVTFLKTHQTWLLQVSFNTPRRLRLHGFDNLLFIREKNRQWMRLFDPEERMMRFPIRKGEIQAPFVPFSGATIGYKPLENIFLEVSALYENSLKEAMQHYSGEQWIYPEASCDPDFLALGCVSYSKNAWVWLILVQLNQQWRKELAGFHQILLRHRADGLGELEIQHPQDRSLYFPIVNWNLKDLFIPMPIAPHSRPLGNLETSLK